MPGFNEIFLGSFGFLILVYLGIPVFPLAYVVLRFRPGEGASPTGLGTTAAVYYLRSLAVLVFLTALALLLQEGVADDTDSELVRTALGLMMGAGVFFGLNYGVGRALSFRIDHTPVQRIFNGFLLVTTGLVTLGAMLVVAVLTVKEGSEGRSIAEPGMWVVVWLCAFLFLIRQLMRVSESYEAQF